MPEANVDAVLVNAEGRLDTGAFMRSLRIAGCDREDALETVKLALRVRESIARRQWENLETDPNAFATLWLLPIEKEE